MSLLNPAKGTRPVYKAALAIGIDYVGQEGAELQGCRRDARNMHAMYKDHVGIDEENIIFMVDDADDHETFPNMRSPTGGNIMQALHELCALSYKHRELQEIWISYSGHGSYLRVEEVAHVEGVAAATEDDGQHETIVPVDWEDGGMIIDDMLNSALGGMRPDMTNPKTGAVTPGVRVIVVVDACHSETAFDLRYKYVSGDKNRIENPQCKVKTDIMMISGCRDDQTSADAPFGPAHEYAGAMTTALLLALDESDYTIHCYTLLKRMRAFLRERKFRQRPQITCSRKLDRSTMVMCYNLRAFSKPIPMATLVTPAPAEQ